MLEAPSTILGALESSAACARALRSAEPAASGLAIVRAASRAGGPAVRSRAILPALLASVLIAGPAAAGEPAPPGVPAGGEAGTDGPLQATPGDRWGRQAASDPLSPRKADSNGRLEACASERPVGRLRTALAQVRSVAGGDTTPPEPPRETDPGKRKSFFRTRTGAVILIVAGAVIVGSAARNSILGDS